MKSKINDKRDLFTSRQFYEHKIYERERKKETRS
jgi:hypothetical protein